MKVWFIFLNSNIIPQSVSLQFENEKADKIFQIKMSSLLEELQLIFETVDTWNYKNRLSLRIHQRVYHLADLASKTSNNRHVAMWQHVHERKSG